MAKKIVVIPGDGIGSEITDSAVEVLKKAAEKFSLALEYEYKDAGGTAYDKFGYKVMGENGYIQIKTNNYAIDEEGRVSVWQIILRNAYHLDCK